MPYHRRMGNLRPVNRIKHVIDANATLGKATVLPTNLVSTTDTPTLGATNSCETGSKVNGIYLKVEMASNEVITGGVPNVYLMVYKNPGGNLVMPAPNAVGSNDNKKYVFHQEMIMFESKAINGNPRVLFNGVIAIPKGYRRNGPNDIIGVDILCPLVNTLICIQAHYKEFR